jgi:hypothetical protein
MALKLWLQPHGLARKDRSRRRSPDPIIDPKKGNASDITPKLLILKTIQDDMKVVRMPYHARTV